MDNRKKLDALTSLRFFAAALIVAFHAGEMLGVGKISNILPATQAVSFFFVLSGFILAYAYQSLDRPGSIKKFYAARIARVWPLHMVTLLLWVAVIYQLDPNVIFWDNGTSRLIASVLMIQAWVPIEVWQTSFNGVAWSISTEMFFYLLFPLLAIKFKEHWHKIFALEFLVLVLLLVVGKHVPAHQPSGVSVSGLLYFFPLSRLLEFTCGIAAFHVVSGLQQHASKITRSQWLFLEISSIALTFITMLMSKSSAIVGTFGAAAGSYFGAAGSLPAFIVLIAVFSSSRGKVSEFLSARLMVFLGEISFALYLSHYAVVVFLKNHPELLGPDWLRYGAVWAVSLSIAALLCVLVERPARTWMMEKYKGLVEAPLHDKRKNKLRIKFVSGITAMVLMFYVVPNAVSQLIPFSVVYESNGRSDVSTYANGVVINALSVTEIPNNELSVLVKFAMKDESTLQSNVAFHLNDKDGNIIHNLGAFNLSLSKLSRQEAGGYEFEFVIKRADYEGSKSLAIALFDDPSVLIPVESRQSDWGGRRAIFSIGQ